MSPTLLSALLACLLALGPADGVYLQDADPSEQAAHADVSRGLSDVSRSMGEALLHGILDSYDPLVIPSLPFNLKLEEITANGIVTNLTITGLSGFKANKLSWQGSKVAVDITLPSIAAVGMYNMTGVLPVPGLATLPLDGHGQVTFGFTGLTLDLSIDLGISDKGQITLDECEVTWNMTKIEFQMKGLLGGAALGSMINSILADSLSHLVLSAYHDRLTTFATTSAAAWLPTIHEDHGTPPTVAAAARTARQRRSERSPLSVEDLRALLGHVEDADAAVEHSDEPVLLGALLSTLVSTDQDDDDEARPLAHHALSALGLEHAHDLDVGRLVSFDRRGEPLFLEHGELSAGLGGGEPDEADSGLFDGLVNALGIRLTGTTLHPHGALA